MLPSGSKRERRRCSAGMNARDGRGAAVSSPTRERCSHPRMRASAAARSTPSRWTSGSTPFRWSPDCSSAPHRKYRARRIAGLGRGLTEPHIRQEELSRIRDNCIYADLPVMPTGATIHQVAPAQRRIHATSGRHNFHRRKPANPVGWLIAADWDVRRRGGRGVVPREIPVESGPAQASCGRTQILVFGESSWLAPEVLGSGTAIMPTSSRSNVPQSRENARGQASSRHNRKVGIRGGEAHRPGSRG